MYESFCGGLSYIKPFVFDHRFYESTVCYLKCLRLREEIELEKKANVFENRIWVNSINSSVCQS